MTETLSPTKQRRKTEWWLLTGGGFDEGAHKAYSGPYSSREDAFVARVTIERLRGANDLWVDSRKVPIPAAS